MDELEETNTKKNIKCPIRNKQPYTSPMDELEEENTRASLNVPSETNCSGKNVSQLSEFPK
jgi:hypothetical protein